MDKDLEQIRLLFIFFFPPYASVEKPCPWSEGEVEVKLTLRACSETIWNMLECAPARVM